MDNHIKKTNILWDKSKPLVSVITTSHNRREVLLRAMRSVNNQTFKELEYIVVDNGSTIEVDDIIERFIEEATIPFKYIKRTNGIGPHTGKNTAIQAARGKYLVMLDSDDELLPNAVEVLYNAFMSIPESERGNYREVVALCEDENGKRIGGLFPPELNYCSKKEAFKIWSLNGLSVEHVNINVTEYLKEYPFPEPEGVTWVVDSVVLWNRMSKRYKSYFINDILKRYYTGSSDSISNTQINRVTEQHLINMLWAHKFELNHWNEYDYNFKNRIDRTLKVVLYKRVLKQKKALPSYDWIYTPVKGFLNNLLMALWHLPCIFGAQLFISKKMQ